MGKIKHRQTKSLHAVKSDFIASLERTAHEAGTLLQTVETLLRHNEHNSATNKLTQDMRETLKTRTEALRDALYEPLDHLDNG